MKVMIEGKIYDSDRTPIILDFKRDDKQYIVTSSYEETVFCFYPDFVSEEEAQVLMASMPNGEDQ